MLLDCDCGGELKPVTNRFLVWLSGSRDFKCQDCGKVFYMPLID